MPEYRTPTTPPEELDPFGRGFRGGLLHQIVHLQEYAEINSRLAREVVEERSSYSAPFARKLQARAATLSFAARFLAGVEG